MKPSFYIASRLENAAAVRALVAQLTSWGWVQSYDWTAHGSVQAGGEARIREVALLETRGVLRADLVIVLLPGGRGTHTELGIALGSGKRVILVAYFGEDLDEKGRTCAFYLHSHVTIVRDAARLEWFLRKQMSLVLRSKRAKKAAVTRARQAAEAAAARRIRKNDRRPRTPDGRVYSRKVRRG